MVTIGKSLTLRDFKILAGFIFLSTFLLMLENDFDHVLKIVIIGDSGVGKSSLLLRYCDDRFSSSQSATVGVDFMVKVLHLMGKKIKLSIWDTYE